MKDLINDRSAWVGFLDTVKTASGLVLTPPKRYAEQKALQCPTTDLALRS